MSNQTSMGRILLAATVLLFTLALAAPCLHWITGANTGSASHACSASHKHAGADPDSVSHLYAGADLHAISHTDIHASPHLHPSPDVYPETNLCRSHADAVSGVQTFRR